MRVCHAVTNQKRWHLKNTALVIDVMDRLQSNKVPVKFSLICKQSHNNSMLMKRASHLLNDQPARGGYGMNSVEAWAMGMPVISGYSGARAGAWYEKVALELWGRIPFFASNGETIDQQRHQLYHGIKRFLTEDFWHKWSNIGVKHYRKFHKPDAVGKLLVKLYKSVL